MLALKPGLIGLGIGLIAYVLLRPFHKTRPFSIREIKALKISLGLVIFLPLAAGIIRIVEEASHYSPHIIYSSGEIIKLSQIPQVTLTPEKAILTWEMSSDNTQPVTISWNGETVSIYSVDTSVYIANQNEILKRIKLGNDDIWYIARLNVIPVKFRKGAADSLAVLAQVRTLLDCYILSVFDSQGQLIYQEVLKRSKRTDEPMQKMLDPASSSEVLIVDVDFPIAYGGK